MNKFKLPEKSALKMYFWEIGLSIHADAVFSAPFFHYPLATLEQEWMVMKASHQILNTVYNLYYPP